MQYGPRLTANAATKWPKHNGQLAGKTGKIEEKRPTAVSCRNANGKTWVSLSLIISTEICLRSLDRFTKEKLVRKGMFS